MAHGIITFTERSNFDLENESNVPLVEIKSDSEDSDVEHLVTLDKKRDKKERRDKDSDKRRERKDPKDLLKDRWDRIKTASFNTYRVSQNTKIQICNRAPFKLFQI